MTKEVKVQSGAITSVKAALGTDLNEKTPRELEYEEAIENAVMKPEGHTQLPDPKNRKRLYAVTTIASSPKFGGNRTPVICDSFERAKEIVETNEGDIWEYSYYLVVIEAIVPNYLYSTLDEQYWYIWDHDSKCYKPIERPEIYNDICGFGIG